MSTHAWIAMDLPSGHVQSVYVHENGYPNMVGAVLVDHYADERRVADLLAYGSIRLLAPHIGEQHSYEPYHWAKQDVCTFFHRDRGDHWPMVQPIIWPDAAALMDAARTSGVYYVYLFAKVAEAPAQWWFQAANAFEPQRWNGRWQQLAGVVADADPTAPARHE